MSNPNPTRLSTNWKVDPDQDLERLHADFDIIDLDLSFEFEYLEEPHRSKDKLNEIDFDS